MPNLINQIQIGNATYDVGYPLIEGSGTTDATAKTSAWTGTHSGITSYYDGLTIRYKIGVAGQTTTTLNINGLGAKQIYRFGTTTLTTHFPVGSIINLVYHADLNDGCWMCNDYDANTNTQARTYKTTSTATYYPILTRYNTSTSTTYTAEYTRYSSKITANHGSGYLKAVKFIENDVELEDKYSPIGHGHTLDEVTDTTTRVAMTPAERTKLAGIATNANNYTHPTTTAATGVPTANSAPGFGGTFQVNQVSRDALGHVSAITPRTITIPNSTATTTTYGLMSAADKAKLDGIATGANKYSLPTATTTTLGGVKVDATLSTTSTNPVQNKVVDAAIKAVKNELLNGAGTAYDTLKELGDLIDDNTDAIEALGKIAITPAERTKLSGIEDGANKYVLPTATTNTLGGIKIGNNITLSDGTISLSKTDITDALGYTPPTTNTTYTNASLGQGYGTCGTAAATAAKVVTLSDYSLTTGGMVAVKFTYAVPANATMNINNKGAKSIYYKGKAIVDGIINAGEVATFIYDGTRYHLLTVDRNRFFTSLVPYGTQITASSSATVDLNTPAYLKVGNYFCSANTQAEFISNLPKAKTAFMMQVYSPLSQTVDNETGTWVYRLRKIIFYTGEEYTQYCYTNGTGGNWTYGPWLQFITSNKTATTTANGLMSSDDKVKLNGIEDVIDEKITAAITTTLNTEV